MKHCCDLTVGEIQYRQRLEDIRLLKLEIKKLRREKHILTKSVANVEELRYAFMKFFHFKLLGTFCLVKLQSR